MYSALNANLYVSRGELITMSTIILSDNQFLVLEAIFQFYWLFIDFLDETFDYSPTIECEGIYQVNNLHYII